MISPREIEVGDGLYYFPDNEWYTVESIWCGLVTFKETNKALTIVYTARNSYWTKPDAMPEVEYKGDINGKTKVDI